MSTNPIVGSDKVETDTCRTNRHQTSHTLVAGSEQLTRRSAVEIAQILVRIGYEGMVPFERSEGYDKDRPTRVSGAVDLSLIGTAQGITNRTRHPVTSRLSGMLMTWVNSFSGINHVNQNVSPMLEGAQFRHQFQRSGGYLTSQDFTYAPA